MGGVFFFFNEGEDFSHLLWVVFFFFFLTKGRIFHVQ